MTLPKFRVYDKVECMMITTSDYDDLSDLFCCLNVDDGFFSELMQSTGLVDMYDKEIFEGDIVHAYSEDARLIGVIEYFDNAYCMKNKDGIYNPLWINAEHYEIIGNIWENPGLWEGEECSILLK